MITILQLATGGVAMGFVYALSAMGIVLIYRTAGVVNFAQGSLVMLGAYVATSCIETLKLPMIGAIIAAVIIMAGVGAAFQRVAYYPLRYAGIIPVVISTIGVSVFLNNGVYVIWGTYPKFLPPIAGSGTITIFGTSIPLQNIAIALMAVALLFFQAYFFNKTWLGKKMQAVAQHQDTAALMGIKVSRMITFTFMYSTALAAIAGIFAGPIFFVSPGIAQILSKAFAASVVGGFGSVPGAVVGGIFVGLVETFGAYFISSAYRDAWAFGLLILFLLFRPQGIFGEPISEKV